MHPQRHRHIVPVLLLASLVGCEPPGEIHVRETDSGVDVTSILQPDTVFGFSPIDSSALLPGDQIGFDGSLVVNFIRHDGGNGVIEFSAAKAYVGDADRPVIGPGGHLGFTGFQLGTIRLNGIPLLQRPHLLPGIDSMVVAGLEYVSTPGFAYIPGSSYTWSIDSIEGTGITIDAPEIIEVLSPSGGAIIQRDLALDLQWTSEEEIVIVISRLGRIGRPVPLLQLKPWHNGFAVLSPKIMDLLGPAGTYMLTFIRANREEVAISRPFFEGTLLVQAATVHNTVIQLR